MANYSNATAVKSTFKLTNMILQHDGCVSWTKLEEWIRDQLPLDGNIYQAKIHSAPTWDFDSDMNRKLEIPIPTSMMKILALYVDPGKLEMGLHTQRVVIWYIFDVPNREINDDPCVYLAGSSKLKQITVPFTLKPIWILKPIINEDVAMTREFYCSEFHLALIKWFVSESRFSLDDNSEIFLSPDPDECGEGFNGHYEKLGEFGLGQKRFELGRRVDDKISDFLHRPTTNAVDKSR